MARHTTSARSLAVAVAVAVLASATTAALAQSAPPGCRDARVVQTTATVAGANGFTGIEVAIARALRDAIAQVNGIYVEHFATLESITSTTASASGLETSTVERFEERLETGVAGFVAGYEVLSRSSEHGRNTVTVRAGVCADPRLLLSVRGARDDAATFVATLVPHLEHSGWTVVLEARSPAEPERAVYLLRSGAVAHLEVDLRVSPQPSHRGVQHAIAIVDTVFTDLRSRELRSATSLHVEGSGAQAVQAAADALTSAATRTGSRIAIRESLVAHPSVAVLVRGVTRDPTRIELVAAITSSAGEAAVTAVDWDRAGATLRLTVTSTLPACDVARTLERQRQLLVRTLSCAPGTVEMQVDRE